MRRSIALRFPTSAATQVLAVIALFVLLLLGAPGARAAAIATDEPAAEASIGDLFRSKRRTADFRDNQSPDYHRANAEYWRVKGERLTVRRKGLLGWLMPKHTRHELAEKHRANHRQPASMHYRGSRHDQHHTVWQAIGLAD